MQCFFFKKQDCPYCKNKTFYVDGKEHKLIVCTQCGNALKSATYRDMKYIEGAKKYEVRA